MNKKPIPEAEFIAMFEQLGAAEMARRLDLATTNIYDRRLRLEKKLDRPIVAPPPKGHDNRTRRETSYASRMPYAIENGVVLVGSDAHYWPDLISTAHRAFVHFARELAPNLKLLVMNGDLFDGARISRHPPIGWSQKPTVKGELNAVEARTDEIIDAAPHVDRLWLMGNHDLRFENRLAQNASEFEDVEGFSLKDKFPRWTMGLSAWVNDQVVIKHRFKGGIHATHNNPLWAGKTVVTGHLHSLKVTPLSDYNGTRWGVDTGTLADPYGPQFEYSEDNPLNHRSGFSVLTFHKGKLLWPEICRVVDETHVDFRGELIEIPCPAA